MTEPEQSQRGWLRTWREGRRAKRQQFVERERFEHEQADEPGGMYRSSSPYQHSGPITYASGFGGDGCGGDGGGGGC